MVICSKIYLEGKRLKKITLITLVFFLSLSCVLIAVEKNAFNSRFYLNAYEDYNIMEKTGKDFQELHDITDDLLDYLKGKRGEEVLEPNFNEREILHMKDVEVLFRNGFILKYISIIISLIIIIYFSITGEKEMLGRYIYKGLFINWIILGLLGIMIFFDFNKYFTYFHYIFFTNDLWLLDPETDLLIQMLPEEFFSSMAINIGLSFLGFVAIIQGIGYAATKKGRGKDEKNSKIFKRQT